MISKARSSNPNILLQKANKQDWPKIRKLYNQAFPPEERLPLWLLRKGVRKQTADMLVIESDNQFVGFAYLVSDAHSLYLFFLAIEPSCRGQGIGSEVLKQLSKRFSNKVLFLAREGLDDRAENAAQRKSRQQFYLRNGLYDIDWKIREGTEEYVLMAANPDFVPYDYEVMMLAWMGWPFRLFKPMKLLPKEMNEN